MLIWTISSGEDLEYHQISAMECKKTIFLTVSLKDNCRCTLLHMCLPTLEFTSSLPIRTLLSTSSVTSAVYAMININMPFKPPPIPAHALPKKIVHSGSLNIILTKMMVDSNTPPTRTNVIMQRLPMRSDNAP